MNKTKHVFNISIKNSLQSTQHYAVSKSLFLTQRIHTISEKTQIIDTFANSWLLFWSNKSQNRIKIISNGELIEPFYNQSFVFIPPYSIVHWLILPGKIEWWALSSDKLFNGIPKQAIMFDNLQINKFVHSQIQINEFVNFFNSQNLKVIEKCSQPHWLSLKLKNLIDKDFQNINTVKQLISGLNVSYTETVSKFKINYGLTPSEYLKRVRTFHCMHRIMAYGDNALQAAIDSGLNSNHQILKLFIDFLNNSPSEFSKEKGKISNFPNLF